MGGYFLKLVVLKMRKLKIHLVVIHSLMN